MGELTYCDGADIASGIGQLYRSAYGSHVESVRQLIEAGKRLTAQKAALPHGEWMLWVKQHQGALGFNDRVARMLMEGARKWQLAADLTEQQALTISRDIWGHEREVSPYPAVPGAFLLRLGSYPVRHDPAEFDELTDEQWSALMEGMAKFESWLQALRARRERHLRRAA